MKTVVSLALATVAWATFQIHGAAQPSSPPPSKTEARPDARGFKDIQVAEFEKRRASGQVVVLDVRTPREFAAGHVPGAVHVDVRGRDFEQKVKTLDPNKTYLVYCGVGVRSANACQKMTRLNFGELYNLAGGFKAWEKAGHKPAK